MKILKTVAYFIDAFASNLRETGEIDRDILRNHLYSKTLNAGTVSIIEAEELGIMDIEIVLDTLCTIGIGRHDQQRKLVVVQRPVDFLEEIRDILKENEIAADDSDSPMESDAATLRKIGDSLNKNSLKNNSQKTWIGAEFEIALKLNKILQYETKNPVPNPYVALAAIDQVIADFRCQSLVLEIPPAYSPQSLKQFVERICNQ